MLIRITTKTYDVMNRLVQTTYPTGGFTRYVYNDVALTTKREVKVDAVGNLGVTISHFDGLYREIQKEVYDPAGTIVVDTQYDPSVVNGRSRILKRSTEGQVWTQFEYDSLNRPTVTTALDGSTVQYSYNGNQTTVTNEAGNRRRYTYDGMGQMTRVEEPNPSLASPLITTYSGSSGFLVGESQEQWSPVPNRMPVNPAFHRDCRRRRCAKFGKVESCSSRLFQAPVETRVFPGFRQERHFA
jgi:YD repeat-containing protein